MASTMWRKFQQTAFAFLSLCARILVLRQKLRNQKANDNNNSNNKTSEQEEQKWKKQQLEIATKLQASCQQIQG